MELTAVFAYGTLMVPAIVSRVLGRDISDLTFQDAVLPGFSRHHITGRDYPAIISSGKLGPEDASVRGTLISNLTPDDMRLLDVFEAEVSSGRDLADRQEYYRKHVTVSLLGDKTTGHLYKSGAGIEAAGEAQAEAYVWQEHLAGLLEPAEWSFESFLRDKADAWAQGKHWEFEDVEKARNGSSDESELAGQKVAGYPEFGKGMRKYWKFREGCEYDQRSGMGAQESR